MLIIWFCFSHSYGYENTMAHPAFNRAIISFSESYLADKLPAYYTLQISGDQEEYRGIAVVQSGYSYYTYKEGEKSMTASEWIEHGGYSADEPELAMAIRHFYDPLGHNQGKKYLTNRGTYWEGIYPNPKTDAIEWATGDIGSQPVPGPGGDIEMENNWSLKKGKEYFVYAFEFAEADLKKEYLAKAFRCLGEVLHNTADMGCPPHVRNDSHAAPMGYHWYSVLGDPDPYEEMFNPKWVSYYDNAYPDPELENFFNHATTIRSVNEKMALFTNRSFFTQETINGIGNKYYRAINAEGDYPQPLLQDLDYHEDDFTFYRIFPSGNHVKMCRDKRIFNRRGQPYIDYDCAKSQASELIPNILHAGAHVIRLFLPEFRIKILKADIDGEVKGQIIHQPNDEYPESIYYSGPVDLINEKTGRSIAELNCDYGDFSGKIEGIKEKDRYTARISLGGLSIQSPVYVVEESAGPDIQNITVMVYANMPADGENQYAALGITNLKPSIENTTVPLAWSGTSFSVQYQYTYLPQGSELMATLHGTITGELSDDLKNLISLEGEEICHYPESDGSGFTLTERISLENIVLTTQGNAYMANYSGTSWRQKLKSIYLSADWPDSPDLNYTSDTIDWDASPAATLTIMMNLIEQ